MRCSHLLHRVDDLHDAVTRFTEAGFTVVHGRRAERSANALIWFETGPFLELVVVPRPTPPVLWTAQVYGGRALRARVERWADRGRHWVDLAVETDDANLAAERRRLRSAGVPVSRALSIGRRTPDGVRLRWQVMAPADPRLPFAMSAYRPPARPSRVVHANGATGVAAVHVGVPGAARAAWDAIVDGDDPWIRAEDGDGIRLVELAGLRAPLDAALVGDLPLVGAGH
ncbi:hypothetical protein BJF78_13615 [Pseudonocardia sp. CNS-139]|nr:hypothetical protein BJF78_13615 [Pseudonocardia sp. CNS-139]